MKYLITAIFTGFCAFCGFANAGVKVYPAPKGIPASAEYSVTVNNKKVFITETKTHNGEKASYGGFDFSGSVKVVIKISQKVETVKIRPASYGITPILQDNTVTFNLKKPAKITLEINDSIINPLHLFANPKEKKRPKKSDSNVIYFDPGVHDVSTLRPKNGQTIYLAGGAYLRCIIPADEAPQQESDWRGQKVWEPFIFAEWANNITICGRGVIDFSGLPWHARIAMWFDTCKKIRIEGITLIGVPNWGIALHRCIDVKIKNIKEICSHDNSDGIDICNSQQVLVEDSFLRNNDDAICVKSFSPAPSPPSKDIVVRDCVIWNERARGLGITSETRTNISNVLFKDCHVIHDLSTHSNCSALAVLVSDSGTVSDIIFDNIRVEDCKTTLIKCWIGKDMWSKDKIRGQMRDVVFRDITANGTGAENIKIFGFDEKHRISKVMFTNVIVNEKLLESEASDIIKTNKFIKDLNFSYRKKLNP